MDDQDRYRQENYLDPSGSTGVTAISRAPMLDMVWSRGLASARGLRLCLLGLIVALDIGVNLRTVMLRDGCGKGRVGGRSREI